MNELPSTNFPLSHLSTNHRPGHVLEIRNVQSAISDYLLLSFLQAVEHLNDDETVAQNPSWDEEKIEDLRGGGRDEWIKLDYGILRVASGKTAVSPYREKLKSQSEGGKNQFGSIQSGKGRGFTRTAWAVFRTEDDRDDFMELVTKASKSKGNNRLNAASRKKVGEPSERIREPW